MDEQNRLGENIRSLRIAYGETQDDLGHVTYIEKTTIVILDGSDAWSYSYHCVQFFLDFSQESFLRRFAFLHFPSREFPAAFEFAVSSLGGKNLILIMDDRSNNLNTFLFLLHHACAFLTEIRLSLETSSWRFRTCILLVLRKC